VAIRGRYDAFLWVDCTPVVKRRFDSVVAKNLKSTTIVLLFSVTEI